LIDHFESGERSYDTAIGGHANKIRLFIADDFHERFPKWMCK
jgi:hypothetical protein